jgi:hypothetical protein
VQGASFPSFVGGGFECATHRRGDGRRLDLVASTGHAGEAAADYAALAAAGLRWARDGLRWHLIAAARGAFDWGSWRPMLDAAGRAGVVVAWDLVHFGLPDWLDPWGSAFVAEAERFAAAAAQEHRRATGRPGLFCPINELSFLAYAGGERGWFAPWGRRRGVAFKRRLLEAAIAMARAIRAADPDARLLWAEPLIAVSPAHAGEAEAAAAQHATQFEAYDMLLGQAAPELGGAPDLADWLGFNHYPHNQRWAGGALIPFGGAGFRALSALLAEVRRRYPDHPLLLAETGAEGPARAAWLHYVGAELVKARAAGAGVAGACLYPVTDYPGWDDDRRCETGLFGLPGPGGRPVERSVLAAVGALEAALAPSPGPRLAGRPSLAQHGA